MGILCLARAGTVVAPRWLNSETDHAKFHLAVDPTRILTLPHLGRFYTEDSLGHGGHNFYDALK